MGPLIAEIIIGIIAGILLLAAAQSEIISLLIGQATLPYPVPGRNRFAPEGVATLP